MFEHVRDIDRAFAEIGRVLRPGGRFVFMVNHPLFQTPGSGWIDDQIVDPPGAVLAGRCATSSEVETVEEVEKDVFIHFVHRPLSRYVNALAANGLLLEHMAEPVPPPGLLSKAPEYPEAASIPRCSPAAAAQGGVKPGPACRAGPAVGTGRKPAATQGPPVRSFAVADVVVITGLSGAGRTHAAADLEDQGWYVVDNLPTTLVRTIVDLASVPGSAIERLALVVGTSPYQADILDAVESLRAADHRVRIVFLEASTPELVKRYGSTRRRHPLGERHARSRMPSPRSGSGSSR